jgi:hypothetical protein
MKERSTKPLLAVIAVLLIGHLWRSAPAVSPDRGDTGPASIVRAQAFELVDKQGKTVAQLHVGEDGGGNLRLRSGDGMVRVKLGATDDGSGLILFDTEAEPAVHLAANKAGTSATLAQKGKPQKVLQP